MAEAWLWRNGCKGDLAFGDCEAGIVWSGPAENIPGRSVLASYIYMNSCTSSVLKGTYIWMARRNIIVRFILGSEGQSRWRRFHQRRPFRRHDRRSRCSIWYLRGWGICTLASYPLTPPYRSRTERHRCRL